MDNICLAIGQQSPSIQLPGAVELMPIGIALLNLNDVRFCQVNREFEIITGYPRDEIIGRSAAELGLCVDAKQHKEVIELINRDQIVRNYELLSRNKRGDLRIIRYDAQLIAVKEQAYLLSTVSDQTEMKRLADMVNIARKEKDALLHELAHRTRNNMQFIISLMDMQAHNVDDPSVVSTLSKLKNKIYSMALVQGKLYDLANLSYIPFAEYINDLILQLTQIFNNQAMAISFEVKAEPISLPIDIAMPCGLILNELITNSILHGFPDSRKGTIAVGFNRAQDGNIELTVSDDGTGPRPGFDNASKKNSGLTLIKLLVEDQLQGAVYFDRSNGMKIKIVFMESSR